MKAVLLKAYGGTDQMYIGEADKPELGPEDVLVMVAATALNRADILQRKGAYPPLPGESEIMGLEMSGEIVALGKNVTRRKVGDLVCGLLPGGGYAEYVRIHQDLAMPVPNGINLIDASAIPEVFLTAYQALFWLGRLTAGEQVLIHAGASGVGTAAIQLAKVAGAYPMVTASARKHSLCYELGAEWAIDYQKNNFAIFIEKKTLGKGVHMILDFVGAPYFQNNLKALAMEGRLVMLGFLGGMKIEEINLAPILMKRLKIMGSTLRSRDLNYKVTLAKDLQAYAWGFFENKKLKPVIDRVMSWHNVKEAHQIMQNNINTGKIILKID